MNLDRFFRPNIVIKFFGNDGELKCLESSLENCVARKLLELARVRPVYRFNIKNIFITVLQLKAQLQFGRGKRFEVFFFSIFHTSVGNYKSF